MNKNQNDAFIWINDGIKKLIEFSKSDKNYKKKLNRLYTYYFLYDIEWIKLFYKKEDLREFISDILNEEENKYEINFDDLLNFLIKLYPNYKFLNDNDIKEKILINDNKNKNLFKIYYDSQEDNYIVMCLDANFNLIKHIIKKKYEYITYVKNNDDISLQKYLIKDLEKEKNIDLDINLIEGEKNRYYNNVIEDYNEMINFKNMPYRILYYNDYNDKIFSCRGQGYIKFSNFKFFWEFLL